MERIEFETPENVVVSYVPAGLGTRFIAWIVDMILQFLLMIAATIVLLFVAAASHNLIHQRFGSKAELWRAAVDHGFGRMVRHMEGVFDPTISDPLEQLRLAIRSFIVFSAEHPELLALMDIEARQDTDRLAYIYETYMAPMYGGIGRLLEYLIAEGRIREVPLRTFHFLIAHGAIAPFTLVPLAEHFDARSPMKPRAIKEHAELI